MELVPKPAKNMSSTCLIVVTHNVTAVVLTVIALEPSQGLQKLFVPAVTASIVITLELPKAGKVLKGRH